MADQNDFRVKKGLVVSTTGTIESSTNAVSSTTGALKVAGGAGIQKDLWVGYGIYSRGHEVPTTATLANYAVTLLTAGTDTKVSASVGEVTVWNTSTLQSVTDRGATTDNAISITDNTAASSTTTGALTVTGGVGIGGDLYVSGTVHGAVTGVITTASNLANGTAGQVPYQTAPGLTSFFGPGTAGNVLVSNGTSAPSYNNTLTLTSTAASTSTSTGALQVRGGVGIAGNTVVGGTLAIEPTPTIGVARLRFGAATGSGIQAPWYSIIEMQSGTSGPTSTIMTDVNGMSIQSLSSGDYIKFSNNASDATNATRLTINGAKGDVIVENSTESTSTSTGALQVRGGVGIHKDTWIGGDLFVNLGEDSLLGASINAKSGSNGNAIQGLGDGTGVKIGVTGQTYATGTNSAGVVGSVVHGGTNASGNVGHYDGTNYWGFYTEDDAYIGSDLQVDGQIIGNFTSTNAKYIETIATATNANFYPVFVNSNNTTSGISEALYTDAGLTFNPSTNNLSISGDLSVNGGDIGSSAATFNLLISNATTVNAFSAATTVDIGAASGTTSINNNLDVDGTTNVGSTTDSSSTTTGALTVEGGAGIRKALYVGGKIVGHLPNGELLSLGNSSIGTDHWITINSLYGSLEIGRNSNTNAYITSNMAVGTLDISHNAAKIQINASDQVIIPQSTAASSTTSGALVVTGGAGIGENLYVGGTIYGNIVGSIGGTATDAEFIKTQSTATNASFYPTFVNSDNATKSTEALYTDAGIVYNPSTNSMTLSGDLAVNGGDLTTNQTTFNLINANATTVNFAGAGTTISIGAATGSTSVKNNLIVTGNLTVQGSTTIVDSTVTNVADPIITIGGGANDADPTADDNKDRGIAFKWHTGAAAKKGFFGFDDSTGYFTFIPDATLTNEVTSGTKGALDANLAGGSAQALVYQSALDTTAFLSAGTSGYLLSTNGTGSAPSWVDPGSLGSGSVKTVQRTTSANHYITFVDSNNSSATAENVYTTSTLYFNPGTKQLTINGSAAALNVIGSSVLATNVSIDPDSYANTVVAGSITDTGWGVTTGIAGNAGTGDSWAFGHNGNRLYLGIQDGSSANTMQTFLSAGTGRHMWLVPSSGNVGIGIADGTAPAYKLEVNGSFAATTKSFLIDHPTKPGMKLRYGSLEGPENGVYVRGRLTGSFVISLPDYWTGLVDSSTITINLTPIGKPQGLYVARITENKIVVAADHSFADDIDCFYTVFAERKDVEKLVVEY